MEIIDVCWAALWIAESCKADDALALGYASRTWYGELLEPQIWRKYLVGPPAALARPVLADRETGELLCGPTVHPDNLRCIVAALRKPGWFRHYQGLKQLASSGKLSQSFGDAWTMCCVGMLD
eukprot:g19347.t1